MDPYRRRLQGFGWLLLIALLALACRLIYIQAGLGDELGRRALEGSLRKVPIPAPRGFILDRRGRVLVGNSPRFVVRLTPAEVNHLDEVFPALGRILKLTPSQLEHLERTARAAPLESITCKQRLSLSQVAQVAELQGLYTGVEVDVEPTREYPNASLACHLLGYIGQPDDRELQQGAHSGEWTGKDGLELTWQSSLKGRPGHRVVQVDATGRTIRSFEEVPPEPGCDLHLTLDLELQRVAERALASTLAVLAQRNGEMGAGVVIAMEADTGRIRALVSLPGYEPGWFSRGTQPRRMQALLTDSRAPLLNRATCGTYPPASTFKLITSMAAFSQNLIPERAVYYCPGVYMVGDLPFNCFVRSGHGSLTYEESLAHSCDVVYYQLGTRMGVATIGHWARACGLGQPTGLDIPEFSGLLPDPDYKQKATGEPWFPGDDANMAIGQGFLAVTPIQMAVTVATLANGGKVLRPYLVESVSRNSGAMVRKTVPRVVRSLELKPEHLRRIRQGMRGAVAYGTATAAQDWEFPLLGKTGTVENLATADNPHGRNHTWFVGYGETGRHPLAVVVFLEKSGGYGGALAAPIARTVGKAWIQMNTTVAPKGASKHTFYGPMAPGQQPRGYIR